MALFPTKDWHLRSFGGTLGIRSVGDRLCAGCAKRKGLGEFYTKGVGRTDARCKDCARRARKKRYRDGKKDLERYGDGRITKVVMIRNGKPGKDFGRDVEAVESIFGNFLVDLVEEDRRGKRDGS